MKKYSLKKFYKDILMMNDLVGNNYEKEHIDLLYSELTIEEMGEISEAIFDKKSDNLMIDGLVDSLVVGFYYLAIKYKIKNVDEMIEKFKYISMDEIFENISFISNLLEKAKIFYEVDNNNKQTIESKIKRNRLIYNNIEDIIEKINSICFSSEYDIIGAANEVMASNFSKFPLVGSVVPENEVAYIESQGRYKNVCYKIKTDLEGNNRYVFLDGNGKFVKPSTFKEPELDQFIPSGYSLINKINS